MGRVNKRAKACDIPQRVKVAVWERDGRCCVFCGTPGNPWCHYISRAHGGMGTEENIVTLCDRCHDHYDHGEREYREFLRGLLRAYLQSKYPGWDENRLIYRKYGEEYHVQQSDHHGPPDSRP